MLGMLLSGPGLAGIAIALALAFGGVQSYRLNSCQADAAAQKAQVAILGASIAEQNRAVDALAKEGAKKQAAAAQALAGATQRARTWEGNAAKLRAVLTAPRKAGETAPVSCDAAWKAIREGK